MLLLFQYVFRPKIDLGAERTVLAEAMILPIGVATQVLKVACTTNQVEQVGALCIWGRHAGP